MMPVWNRSKNSSLSARKEIRSSWKRACGRCWKRRCWLESPGAYQLAQELPSIQVPPTVQAVLAARIDRLPQDQKSLLQTAAVIGTEVPFTLVQAIAEMSEDTLYRGLIHLQATEFLYETSLFPERVYTFKHALTHEVAYNSLLQERRRVLHAHIVGTLETLSGDRLSEQVERLAHHAIRGAVWDKALTYFRQAGQKALRNSANREAVSYFDQALSVLQHLPESHDNMARAIDLRLDLRTALLPLGEFDRILALLCETESLAETLGDRRCFGWVLVFILNAFWLRSDHGEALKARPARP